MGLPIHIRKLTLNVISKIIFLLHLSIVLSTNTLPNHEWILRTPVQYNPLFGYWRLGGSLAGSVRGERMCVAVKLQIISLLAMCYPRKIVGNARPNARYLEV